MLADRLGSKEAATAALKDAGIPGIKYLDQGSRDLPIPKAIYAKYKPEMDRLTAIVENQSVTPGARGSANEAMTALHTKMATELEKSAGVTRNFVVFDPAILEDVTRK
jgi:hypothetical protein